MKSRIQLVALAFWWGSLTCIGFLVVPLLFKNMESRHAAGQMAAILFQVLNYITWLCGALLLMTHGNNKRSVWLISTAITASVFVHFVAAPHIAARDHLQFWHPIGSLLYALQWLIASRLLLHIKLVLPPR